MEDDDEIHSVHSGGSGSPSSPRFDGRITVTVAAAPPPQSTLTLALPIQQLKPVGTAAGSGGVGGGGGGGGGREDCWSGGATAILIDAWRERFLELTRGSLKQKHWKDVADIVNSRVDYMKTPKTDMQCKNRIDTVKKKYKLELAKIGAGQGRSNWPFFDQIDQLIGPTLKVNPAVAGPSNLNSGNQKVPMGIPMGVRSLPHLRRQQQQQPKQKQQSRKRPTVDSDSSDPVPSPETFRRKRPKIQRESMNPRPIRQGSNNGGSDGRVKKWGNSMRELTGAILKFGEAYEQAETANLQQMVEMEKQRMKFAKELELQRTQSYMKRLMELSQGWD